MLNFAPMGTAGYWALLAASFLSATVVPFSSEAALAAVLVGGGDPMICLLIATLGNTAGGMTGYLLGRWGRDAILAKRFNIRPEHQAHWQARIHRYGPIAAVACWLPGVGDLIAVALGALKTRWLPTLFWMAVGKGVRYAVVVGLVPL